MLLAFVASSTLHRFWPQGMIGVTVIVITLKFSKEFWLLLKWGHPVSISHVFKFDSDPRARAPAVAECVSVLLKAE